MNKLLILVLIASLLGCNNKNMSNKSKEQTVKYYSTFAGYTHPIKLLDEINSNDLIEKDSYYIATYENDKIVKVEKFLNKKLSFTYVYTYNENGELKFTEIIDKNGKKNIVK